MMTNLFSFFVNLPFSTEVQIHRDDHGWCESTTMVAELATGGFAMYIDQLDLTGLESVSVEVDGVMYTVCRWHSEDGDQWEISSSALGYSRADESLVKPGEHREIAPDSWTPFRDSLGELIEASMDEPDVLGSAMTAYWLAHGQDFSPDGEHAFGFDMYFVSFADQEWRVVRTRDGHVWSGLIQAQYPASGQGFLSSHQLKGVSTMTNLFSFFSNLPFSSEVVVARPGGKSSVIMTGELATGGHAMYVDQLEAAGLERVIFDLDGVEYTVSRWVGHCCPEWQLTASVVGTGIGGKLLTVDEALGSGAYTWTPFRDSLGELIEACLDGKLHHLPSVMRSYRNAFEDELGPDGEFHKGWLSTYLVAFHKGEAGETRFSVIRVVDGHEWVGYA